MNTTRTTSRNRRLVARAIVAATATIATGNTAAAQSDPPPWEHCTHYDHPAAVDLGGILPVNFVPPPETQAALRGDIAVGTDCSIYDLPV